MGPGEPRVNDDDGGSHTIRSPLDLHLLDLHLCLGEVRGQTPHLLLQRRLPAHGCPSRLLGQPDARRWAPPPCIHERALLRRNLKHRDSVRSGPGSSIVATGRDRPKLANAAGGDEVPGRRSRASSSHGRRPVKDSILRGMPRGEIIACCIAVWVSGALLPLWTEGESHGMPSSLQGASGEDLRACGVAEMFEPRFDVRGGLPEVDFGSRRPHPICCSGSNRQRTRPEVPAKHAHGPTRC
jgi:hypothetical protein